MQHWLDNRIRLDRLPDLGFDWREQVKPLIQRSFSGSDEISPDKWDEQVLRIGETVTHEEANAAPHRGSSTQAG